MSLISAARDLNVVRESHNRYAAAGGNRNQRSFHLHERGIQTAKRYREVQSDMIDILGEIDEDETYLLFETTSLYQYCVKFHELSEDTICDLIAIMRKSKTVPELKEAIRDGAIKMSSARRLASVITPENKEEWLELASSESCRVVEKAIATEFPKFAVQESIRYKTKDRLEMKLGISEEWRETLKQTKDVASQKAQSAVDSEDAIFIAMKFYLQRNDPLEKAERARLKLEKKKLNSTADVTFDERAAGVGVLRGLEKLRSREHISGTCRINSRYQRVPMNSALKHAVMLRDLRQCTHVDATGDRCEDRRWLDVHHVIEVSKGGADELSNLTTLCGAHHRSAHKPVTSTITTATHHS